ncbi:protein sco1 homolog 1 mitochondrial [Phtheirospermum japonicum]|uniref:Protein sco1 homolog 1 mitochondrial n=1 Tax=Phtheirospermum japonicum TaxID=374723 RepID=A0A830CBW6_9LAMI|nr:protein sco1 homolog 1 mitochondrial [Phtheirospermum japonicum]
MSSAFLRNSSRLRQIYCSFNSQLSSSNFHSLHHYKSIPKSTLISVSPGIFADNQYKLVRAFSLNRRFLCTGTSNPSVNQPTSSSADTTPSSGSAEGNSGNKNDGGQSSGGSQNTSQQGKSVRGGPVSWVSFFLLLCTGAGLVYYYDKEKRRHIEEINTASTAVRQGPSAGKAAIGGPFNLIDHNGKPVTDKDFIGKWNLIYFGFTHCPDICPDELIKMAEAIDKIKKKSGMEVVPVFISVDPERDNVEQVREYVKEFHPKLIGLTGSPDEVKNAARAYRVYYMKTEEEGSDYLVDHSIVMYLMDPNMQFVKFFGKNFDAATLADGVIQEIKQHKKVRA